MHMYLYMRCVWYLRVTIEDKSPAKSNHYSRVLNSRLSVQNDFRVAKKSFDGIKVRF